MRVFRRASDRSLPSPVGSAAAGGGAVDLVMDVVKVDLEVVLDTEAADFFPLFSLCLFAIAVAVGTCTSERLNSGSVIEELFSGPCAISRYEMVYTTLTYQPGSFAINIGMERSE